MLKLIIVDDETIVRQGLKKVLPWKELNVRYSGEAENVARAIEVAKEVRPDIVLCDIRMPGGEGFALIEQIQTYVPWVQFIMITAYANLEYMKQAIHLQVCDFLLKPARVEDIVAAIKNASERVRKYQNDNAYKNVMMEYLDVIRENLVSDFLTGRTGPEETLENAVKVDLDFTGPFYYVLVLQGSTETSYELLQTLPVKIEGCRAIAAEVSEEARNLVVILNVRKRIDDQTLQDINEQFQIGKDRISAMLTDMAEVPDAYREILEKAKTFGEAGDTAEESVPAELDRIERTLYEAVKYQDSEEEMTRLFAEYLQTAFDQKVSTVTLKHKCRQILYTIQVLSGTQDHSLEIHTGDMNKERLLVLFSGLCQDIRRHVNKERDEVSEKALYYIRKRYKEDLMVEQIAAELFLSSSYLSRIIKENTGHGFGHWLNYYRIEAAKRMLADGNLSVERVAKECGYNSYRIFSENFRKYTGMTATSWRQGQEK